MENALGEAQTIVLLGGTSDIGRAIVERLVSPATRTVVLAGRRPDEMRVAELRAARRDGRRRPLRRHRHRRRTTRSCATSPPATATSTSSCVAFGQLVDQAELDDDPARAAAMVTVNYTGAVSVVARRRRPVPPPGPRPPRRAVERRRRAGAQGQLRVRLVEGRPRRLRPGPRRRPRRVGRQRARRAPGLRALADDRGDEGGAVRHHAGRRRRRHRQGAAPRAAARCGCRARCVRCSACSATSPARSGAASRSADARSSVRRSPGRPALGRRSRGGGRVDDVAGAMAWPQTFPPLQYDFLPEVPSFTVVSDDFDDGERMEAPQASGMFGVRAAPTRRRTCGGRACPTARRASP